MLYLIQRRTSCTIMNKIGRFLSRNSAKTCLKWIILVVNPPKSPSTRSSARRSPFRLNDYRNVQDPTLIEFTGWCRWLANLGQNETYVLYFLPPPSTPVQKPWGRESLPSKRGRSGDRPVKIRKSSLWGRN